MRKQWRRLSGALRCLGAVSTAGALVLAALFAVDVSLASEYGGMNEAMAWGRRLVWWLLAMLALALAWAPLTKRILRSDSWREALSWTAAKLGSGVRAGALTALGAAVAALFVMAVMSR